jgi:hypothetical protein
MLLPKPEITQVRLQTLPDDPAIAEPNLVHAGEAV